MRACPIRSFDLKARIQKIDAALTDLTNESQNLVKPIDSPIQSVKDTPHFSWRRKHETNLDDTKVTDLKQVDGPAFVQTSLHTAHTQLNLSIMVI